MDIVSRMAAQNFECLPFAVLQMLIEVLGMLVADEPCQCRPDQAAGAASNGRRRKNAEHRTSGGSYCKAAEHGGHIDAGADDGALRVADGFIGNIGDARSLGIVLELGG